MSTEMLVQATPRSEANCERLRDALRDIERAVYPDPIRDPYGAQAALRYINDVARNALDATEASR